MNRPAAAREKRVIALDRETPQEADALVAPLGNSASFYEIGFELAFSGGLSLAQELIQSGKDVFLDLKLHDIPTTL